MSDGMDDDSQTERALRASRPSEDPIALSVAQAHVAAALFGAADAAPAQIGRFRLLGRLGAGGVGVVYTGYDPELDRAVALKLVRVAESGRAAALAEARALAQLSHPNVVPVHDVGIVDDHVFIVLELVRGQTLGAWARQPGRAWADVVEAYLQAAHGLAAAHAAGLVHRDFKPDNAIVGDDGRVRVVDFGLASAAAAASASGRPVGTPRYMAPEQAAGLAPTPAVDQFSFSTAMLEALGQTGGAPRWLEATLTRGAAPDPDARFESMTALIRQLSRDPARARVQWGVAVLVVCAVAAAFFAGRAPAADVCGGAPAAIAAVWTPDGRGAALARLATLGDYGKAVAARLDATLTAWEARWALHQREACLSHRRGEQSDAQLDRRVACLTEARAALAAIAETVRATELSTLAQLVAAVPSLPNPESCADPEAAPPEVAQLRAELARAQILVAASRRDAALKELTALIARARAVGHAPTLAEALYTLAELYFESEREKGIVPAAEALRLSLASGSNGLAVKAWALRAYAIATRVDSAKAMDGFELIEAMASRERPPSYSRVLLYNAIGAVAMAQGDPVLARHRYQRALDESRALVGREAALAIKVKSNLAVTITEPAARDAMLREAIAEQTRLLGADHPRTLVAQTRLAGVQLDLGKVIAIARPACETIEALHPKYTNNLVECWRMLSFAYEDLGQRDRALEAMRRMVRLNTDSSDLGDVGPGYVALWSGDAHAAAGAFDALLKKEVPPPDEPWWSVMARGQLQMGLALALLGEGRAVEGEAALNKAMVSLVVPPTATTAMQAVRDLARARAALATSLARRKKEPARVAELAQAAANTLRAAGAPAGEIERLEKLSR